MVLLRQAAGDRANTALSNALAAVYGDSLTTRIGEIPMRPRQSPHQEVRSTASEFDFFVPAEQALPRWQALPEETRQTLTSFLTRLILEHARADYPP